MCNLNGQICNKFATYMNNCAIFMNKFTTYMNKCASYMKQCATYKLPVNIKCISLISISMIFYCESSLSHINLAHFIP